MIVYISGPITDNPNYKKDFETVEKELWAAGHIPVNPIMPEGLGLKEQYLQVNIAQLMMCDAIYVLPGSEDSIGSIAEQITANFLYKKQFRKTEIGYKTDYRANGYIFKSRYSQMRNILKQYITALPTLNLSGAELEEDGICSDLYRS